MITEREEKYRAFVEDDINNNRGLIVNQYSEVLAINDHPIELEAFRQSYLTNLLTYVTRHSDFYKKYENYKRLSDFPIVNKEILKEHWDEVFVSEFKDRTDNKEKRTSGSTGTPFQLYWDRRKHCRMIADAKWFSHLGNTESHERIVCMIVNEKGVRSPLEKQQRDNLFNIYCSYFDDESIRRIFKELNELKPKMIIAYSSMWDAIANYIFDGKTVECDIQPVSIMAEAEGLKERTREIISEYFHCPVYSRYGNEESGTLAQEDGSGNGHRVNAASYEIEVLDLNEDKPAGEGEIGRVVITDLFNYAFPLIRYENGDLAVKKVTEDGRVYLEDVIGRKVDMLYTTDGKMVNWLHSLIFLKKYRDIKQFQVIQESRYNFTWMLNTQNHNYEDLIHCEVKEIFGEDSIHRFEYVDKIPTMRSGKTKMTVCKIDPKKEFLEVDV